MSNGEKPIIVLYKIINAEDDRDDPCYNAFEMPRGGGGGGGKGPTLAAVKHKCAALYSMNHLGPEGYHWRVFVEDKPTMPGSGGNSNNNNSSSAPAYSWWDIQDENATLPVKQASQTQLRKFFFNNNNKSKNTSGGNSSSSQQGIQSDSSSMETAAKGALKSLGKAMSHAVSVGAGHDGGGTGDQGPPVSVIAFKLLDLVKMHDDFSVKRHGGGRAGAGVGPVDTTTMHHHHHQPPQRQQQQRPAPTPARGGGGGTTTANGGSRPGTTTTPATPATVPARQQQQSTASGGGGGGGATRATPRPRAPPPPPASQQQRRQQPQQPENLMDFGSVGSSGSSGGAGSLFPPASGRSGPRPNESRAEKLKREYNEKKQKTNLVWDEVDQRFVEANAKASLQGSATGGSSGSGSGIGGIGSSSDKKVKGISLDPANAVGKSAAVQQAVNARVHEMKTAQNKALEELRVREEKKKVNDAEEDIVRQKLEPKIKQWSEEHGKKKQLRALLGSLHTILWKEANWKPISIGDILDDSKVKKCFHKASRVVHPDKTHQLDAEKRFLAKRIFDALSQAKTEFDNGAK